MSFTREKALALVERAAQNRRLSHAYLITGPAGSGKEAVAIRMVEMTRPPGSYVPAATLQDLRNATTLVVAAGSIGGPRFPARGPTTPPRRVAKVSSTVP